VYNGNLAGAGAKELNNVPLKKKKNLWYAECEAYQLSNGLVDAYV
jgi:hypothetical protein